jgi:hypothetical protein
LRRLLAGLWAALLPTPERERLLQRLDTSPPVVKASWTLAALQVALGPVWFLRGLAYAQAYAARGVAILLNSPLKDAEQNATGAFVGSPLYFLSYMATLEGFVLEYLIATGIFRIVVLVGSGRPVGDPIVSAVAWLLRTRRRRSWETQRLRRLGPERPDRILEALNGGLVVLCSREKLSWHERVSIQFGEDLFRLVRVEERPRGEWTDIAYVLRPQEPGEIIRDLVRLDGVVTKRRPRTTEGPMAAGRADNGGS